MASPIRNWSLQSSMTFTKWDFYEWVYSIHHHALLCELSLTCRNRRCFSDGPAYSIKGTVTSSNWLSLGNIGRAYFRATFTATASPPSLPVIQGREFGTWKPERRCISSTEAAFSRDFSNWRRTNLSMLVCKAPEAPKAPRAGLLSVLKQFQR